MSPEAGQVQTTIALGLSSAAAKAPRTLLRMCARIFGPVEDYFRLRRSSNLRF